MGSSTSVLPPQAMPKTAGAATLMMKGVLKCAMRERRLMKIPSKSNSCASLLARPKSARFACSEPELGGPGTGWHKRDGVGYDRLVTQAPRLHRYTFHEYLVLEESSTVRHEFLAGEIYAMAGGTPQHAATAMAVGAALVAQARGGPCRVHSSDLRVRALATGLTTYPDVTMVCGPYESDPQDKNTIVNPRRVVEVTSDSTEDYDRGEKLDSYQRTPSIDAIVIVSHREQLIEVFERQANSSWRRSEARTGAQLRIAALGATLSVDDVYAAATPPQ